MAIGESDLVGPLARARRVMRETPEPGWAAVEQRVIDAVRKAPRGGWPFAVADPDAGSVPGTISVTDVALRAVIANALRDDPDSSVGAIDVSVQDLTVTGVRLEITGRYGADLNVVAGRALSRCARIIEEVVGAGAEVPLEVVVTDVHR